MRKNSTVQAFKSEIFEEQKLTIGLDLGDRWSFYCVLDEAGQVILEQTLPTTPEAMKQTFGKIPRSLIALETGTHSPWVSRLLTELGHKVIVAHAQKVQLIAKSNVGCFLGLRPGRRNSGESEPQKGIRKEGDRYLRTMMVQGAHYILGPFGEDSDLRRWGLKEEKMPRSGPS
jgi:transposase